MKVPLRVLLVQDSAAAAGSLMQELHEGGYDLSCRSVATAGEMAMALDGEPCDIVLADYLLPGFGGLAVLAFLKGRGLDIPCLVYSVHDEAETAVAAMKAGARDYLVKGKSGRLVPAVQGALRETSLEPVARREEMMSHDREEKFRRLVECNNDLVWEVDENVLYTYLSPVTYDLWGYRPDELIGKTPFDIMAPEEAGRVKGIFGPISARREPFTLLENTVLHKDGYQIVIETSGMPVFDEQNVFRGYRGIDRDISKRKRTEEKLRSLQMAVETMQIGVTITDLNGSIIYTNPAEAMMHGYTVEELIGKDVRVFAPPAIWNKMPFEQIERMGSRHRESSNVRKDGIVFPVHLLSDVVVDNNGNPLAVVSTCEDITERKRIEEKLTYMSTHDSLTGLYNRTFFDEELARLGRGRRFPVSVLIGDVDDLKEINDTLGHEAGDMQIRKAAKVMVEALRADDIVARIGGDEFAAILPQTDAAIAHDVIARIRDALAVENGSHAEPELSVSLGVATVEDGKRLIDAWKLADMRMYEDKLLKGSRRTGKNQAKEKHE